ncbi:MULTISPECIES: hypothetical protein [Pseudomonas]|uniref:hypothetical protein n=1 Tax=Pseudomonas TaxID=286 RepID=UPI00123B65AD|nr:MULTISPECIES: hypothetical protein [Pseudomonas]QIB51133.1 hypothetical protein G3M63_08765 [Pseudomonas sp. OIL-1]
MRQPDVEIYLREDHLDALTSWLEQTFEGLELKAWNGLTRHGTLRLDGQAIPLMIVRKAAGKWASVWFDSDATPWDTDLDCARAIQAATGHEVRCSVGGWSEEQGDADADRWMKVNEEGETEFIWAQKP